MISLSHRITVEEHLAAKARLNRPPLPDDYIMPDGRWVIHWYAGTVDIDDYTRRDGHACRVAFYGQSMTDRFGWPEGDPNSPAILNDPRALSEAPTDGVVRG